MSLFIELKDGALINTSDISIIEKGINGTRVVFSDSTAITVSYPFEEFKKLLAEKTTVIPYKHEE